MKLKHKIILFCVLILGSMFPSYAQNLQSIEVVHVNDKTQEVRYNFDTNIINPTHFMSNNTIVLDLPKARLKAVPKNRQVNNALIKSINNVAGDGKVRSQIALLGPVTYSVSTLDSTVIVSLTSKNEASNEASSATGNMLTKNTTDRGSSGDVVEFNRNSKGSGVVTIQLPSENAHVQTSELSQKIQVKINGHVWSPGEEKRLAVTDFATPVKQVEVINAKGAAMVNISTQAGFEYSAYQAGSKYVVEVKPKRNKDISGTTAGDKIDNFDGERLSLNFQDIEVRAVLQIIADFTGLNIVVSDSVSSRVTVRLIDVPWDQALDVILRTKGLGMRQQGQVVYIAPQGELVQIENLEPLINEIIQINYAKAADVAKVLADGKSGAVGSASAGLSTRGTVSVDPRTNNLIIQDTVSQIKVVKELIAVLDQAIKQVQIDAKVVVATDDFTRELGVKWGGVGRKRIGENGLNVIGGNQNTNTSLINGDTIGDSNGGARTGFNLAAASSTSTLAFSILRSSFLLELELSAMQSNGKGETLASPRVFTADRQTAYIKSGRQIPFNKVDDAGNTTTEFKEVVLQLTVTPQITPDNKVILDLTITKDDLAGASIEDGFTKNEIKTQAIVSDGETVVLGGVYSEINNEQYKKVPFLADIPYLGKLFQNKATVHSKAELLIFVTPRIVNPTVKN